MVAGQNYQKHVDNFGSIAWTPAAFGLICGPVSDLLTKIFNKKSPAYGQLLGVLIFVIIDLLVGIIFGVFQVIDLILLIIKFYEVLKSVISVNDN